MFDLIVRNGRVVDGSGLPAYSADLGIKDGKILQVGGVIEDVGAKVIDAEGKVVAPGFIDPHAHFDCQLLFDGEARPILEHGVTTVVTGSCSISFAPLHERDRPALVAMFQLIEEMPDAVFPTESNKGAFEWKYETFEEYIAYIKDSLAINVAPMVGHTLLRIYVMGEAAGERGATPEELEKLKSCMRECMEAGAVGLSTSMIDYNVNQLPVPCRFGYAEELETLCEVVGEFGGTLQVVPEFFYTDIVIARIDQIADLSRKYGIATTISPLFDSASMPEKTERVMNRIREQVAMGARIWPQVQTRPIDISFSFDIGSCYFGDLPIWYHTLLLPREEKLAKLTDPEFRMQMVMKAERAGNTDRFSYLKVRECKDRSLVGRTLKDLAEERDSTPANVMIDLSLEEDLHTIFIAENMDHDDSARIGALLQDNHVHIGASDAGAHIQSFSTYGDTGYLFSEFVRKGGYLTVEQAVKKVTSDTALIWGIKNRGLISEGYEADLVIFDPETFDRGPEIPVNDLPEEGMRYIRESIGVSKTIVNGEVVWDQEGGYTGAKVGVIAAA